MTTQAGANPYSAPQARVADVGTGEIEHAEEIRREYLKHETSVRSVGSLYILTALLFLAAAVLYACIPFFGAEDGRGAVAASIGLAVVFGILSWLFYKLARGLRALQSWTRIPTAIVAGIGLLGFPIGTLINGYIMWLVLSKKGTYVLSPEYAEIVAATPHIKQKTSILVWIFLGLIVLLVVIGVIAAITAKY